MKRTSWVSALATIALSATGARAQGVSQKALAESLFQEGRRLMAEDRVAEACRKLEESQRLVPKLGTLLNLATCHEKEGKTATAWAEFQEAVARASRQDDAEREAYAREHVRALEARLAKLVVHVRAPKDDLVVLVGKVPLDPSAWGAPVPIDPGAVDVRAERAGKIVWKKTIEVPSGPGTTELTVPANLPAETSGAAKTTPAPQRDTAPPAPANGTLERTLGFVGIGLGVVGVGVGSYFGVRTFRLKEDSMSHCRGELCDPEGVELRDDARRAALISTIAFGVGLAAAGAGTVLLITAPTNRREVGLGFRGRF